MLTIIIAVILATLFALYVYKDTKSKELTIFLAVITIILGVMIAVGIPSGEYEEPIISEEVTLTTIAQEEGKDCYLIVSTDGEYIYKIDETKNEYGAEEGNIKISSESLEITSIKAFEEDRNNAVLRKYVCKGKNTLFSFAMGRQIEEYVFLVPNGTIIN